MKHLGELRCQKDQALWKDGLDVFRLARQNHKNAIKSAKKEYKGSTSDPVDVWNTLRTITNYKKKSPAISPSTGPADELRTFYIRNVRHQRLHQSHRRTQLHA